MSDDAPMRLKHARATSPELAQALRALGRSSDVERLERVAQQLESALAGVAPQPSAAGGLGSFALKWMIAGVLAATGFWAWHATRPQPLAAVSARPAVVSPPLAAVGAEAPSPSPSPSPRLADAHLTDPPKPRARAHGERQAKMPTDANAAPPAAIDTTPTSAPVPSPATEPAPTPPALHERSHSQPPPAAAAQSGERSEAALLLAARKAQPSAALRLLAEHATRFPDGLLTPEREVLRIEALRKLGRSAEAEQDLRAFQARYPDSIHLRRLLATRPD